MTDDELIKKTLLTSKTIAMVGVSSIKKEISNKLLQGENLEGGDSVEIMDSTHHRYLCYQFDRDRLVGATTVGRSHDLGIIKGLIRSKASLGRLKEKLKEQPDRLKEIYLEWSKPGFRI